MSGRFDTAAAPWCDTADRNLAVKLTRYIGLYYHKVGVKLVHHLFPPKKPQWLRATQLIRLLRSSNFSFCNELLA